ncbi:MAG: hypothetical protein AAFX94_25170, partial [Myxococcota bacterium]
MCVYVVALLAVSAPELAASAQVAPGYGDSGGQLLLKPRLAWEAAAFRLHLGAPIVLNETGDHAFNSAEAWTAWVERFELQRSHVRLAVGALDDVGRSLSIEGLQSKTHPTDLRSGAQLSIDMDSAHLEVFTSVKT